MFQFASVNQTVSAFYWGAISKGTQAIEFVHPFAYLLRLSDGLSDFHPGVLPSISEDVGKVSEGI